MVQSPPDIVLLGADWQARTLIRAQLIEDRFEVIATDTWATMRRHLRPGSKPRLAILDLKELSSPREVLNDLRVLMPPNRVLVLGAIGTVPASEVEQLGFRMISRPFVIRDVVAKAAELVRQNIPS